jgi:hypothetical protein
MADQGHGGTMIALVPAMPDSFVVPGGESAEDLHVTLCYWEPADEGFQGYRDLHLMRAVIDLAVNFPPLEAEAFSVDVFNPGSDAPCIVLGISGDQVAMIRNHLVEMVGTGMTKQPWVAHMTLNYTGDYSDLEPYVSKLGPVVFSHIRFAQGDMYVDYPLSGAPFEGSAPMEQDAVQLPETVDSADEYVSPQRVSEASADMQERPVPGTEPLADPVIPEYQPPIPVDVATDSNQPYVGLRFDDNVTASINTDSWSSMPIAPRETSWDADDSIARISSWAGGDGNKFGRSFLWKKKDGQPLNPDSYRLPVADVVNGKLTLIPRAVFEAGKILSGAHGALENVITDAERDALKAVVTEQYNKLQEIYQDPRMVAPWLRGRTPSERAQEEKDMGVEASITAAVNSSGWSSMPIADAGTAWDGNAARDAVFAWADGNWSKYRRAFIWYDAENPELKGSYKLPIATIINGRLTIVPKAVGAALGALSGARGTGVELGGDSSRARTVLEGIQRRIGNSDSMSAAGVLEPPSEWFANPNLTEPTLFTVTADGQVFGHLAQWNVCHAGIANRCLMAPKSTTNYRYFMNGQVLTADGSLIKVGRITVGTGHADRVSGLIAAAEHYDNSGTATAVVRAGEDRFGIWVAGAVVAGATPQKIAEMRRCPLSGDWRRAPEGNLELVAALAVNTPGFPILYETNGEVASLMAAGIMVPEETEFQAVPEPIVASPGREARIQALMSGREADVRRGRKERFEDIFGG